jgi:site-specific DNA-methyltransferase (adenine-specific)
MKVINGNNIEVLKQYPDNYFDAIVTDPPYGLGKEPNAEELMKDWIEKGYHEISGTGFMGKEWDAFIPQPLFWKEAFRVLKHGGHVVSFFGTRTYDWGVMSMRFAGFEVRDCIQWLYGSGFPKSHSVSKAIDKMNGAEREVVGKNVNHRERNNPMSEMLKLSNGNITTPSTKEAKEWDGWGSALKPANEPIVLARKPLEKGLTIAENVLKWGTGAINIDGCRVSVNDKENYENNCDRTNVKSHWGNSNSFSVVEANSQGRFPANLILTHHEDCECFENEDWNCVDDCPIKVLDEQSGILKSGAMDSIAKGGKYNVYSTMTERRVVNQASQGGASRFFYVAKASKSERNKGLDGFDEKEIELIGQMPDGFVSSYGNVRNKPLPKANFHPTVKPIKLMQYLVRLITPPNGIVLDPFCGSGTTGVACKLEGVQFVGLEQDAEYCKIAQSRIDNYEEEIEEIVYVTNEQGGKTQIIQTSLF